MSGDGPVREEAERLAAAVLDRLAAVRALGGMEPAYDAEQSTRLAKAAGDVAVAVTGLLRELAQTSGRQPGTPGLRETFAGFATGLVEAAGIDLHAEPAPAEPPAWRAAPETGGASAGATGGEPAGEEAGSDPWRAATRAAYREWLADAQRPPDEGEPR